MTRLTVRDRRAVVVGAAIVAAALIALRGVPALLQAYAAEREGVDRARRRLSDAQAALARAGRGEDTSRSLSAEWTSVRSRMFSAATPNLLSARVAAHLSRAARAANVEMLSIQIRSDTIARGGLREAFGRASARGDIRGLAALLRSMEGGTGAFRVSAIAVTQSDPLGRPEAPERLSMELTFSTLAVDSSAPAAPKPTGSDTVGLSLARTIVAGNLFRLDRSPAPVTFTLQQAAPKQLVQVAVVQRPRLVLRGIVGPPWQALVEGIPGRDAGIVVKSGDRFGDLRIESIRTDTVVVRGADTTWRLTVARAWR